MTDLTQVWAAAAAEGGGEFAEDITPDFGVHIVQVGKTRTGTDKRGENYFAVDLKLPGVGKWSLFKAITKGGVPDKGRVQSAQILLRQLGLDASSPAVLNQLPTIQGKWYSVEVKAATQINPNTGAPYRNTDILGVASAPAQAAPTVAQPAPAPQGQMLDQAMTAQVPAGVTAQVAQGMQFPAAVPGQAPTVVAPQAPAPQQAQAQDDIPF